MSILLLAVVSLVVRPTGAGLGGATDPAGPNNGKLPLAAELNTNVALAYSFNHIEIPLVMGAKTNGYTVKDLGGFGIEVTCQGVVAGPVKSEGKYGTAESEYKATATAGAKAEGSVSLGPERTPVEGVTASSPDKPGSSPGSKPIGGAAVTAPAPVQGTVEVRAEAVAEGTSRASAGPPGVVSDGTGTVVVSQKVEFKDGNATFRLCYTNLKNVTVVLGK